MLTGRQPSGSDPAGHEEMRVAQPGWALSRRGPEACEWAVASSGAWASVPSEFAWRPGDDEAADLLVCLVLDQQE